MNQQDALKQPFFARFLEAQKQTQATAENFTGMDPEITLKPFIDMEHTLKYPSDGDET